MSRSRDVNECNLEVAYVQLIFYCELNHNFTATVIYASEFLVGYVFSLFIA